MSSDDRPTLDAHAHIAPDVTDRQLAALGNTKVLAVTRSIAEARQVVRRRDRQIIWGLGVHPGLADALYEYDEDTFQRALPHFALVGEIGLDRSGNQRQQRAVLDSILNLCQDQPVVLSLHSTGRTEEILDALADQPQAGAILHWFNGTTEQIAMATALGCHFSVNAAMDPEFIAAMPPDRLLTETDFPSLRRRTKASRPGDVCAAEQLIGAIHQVDARGLVWENLARLLDATGAADRVSGMCP